MTVLVINKWYQKQVPYLINDKKLEGLKLGKLHCFCQNFFTNYTNQSILVILDEFAKLYSHQFFVVCIYYWQILSGQLKNSQSNKLISFQFFSFIVVSLDWLFHNNILYIMNSLVINSNNEICLVWSHCSSQLHLTPV